MIGIDKNIINFNSNHVICRQNCLLKYNFATLIIQLMDGLYKICLKRNYDYGVQTVYKVWMTIKI